MKNKEKYRILYTTVFSIVFLITTYTSHADSLDNIYQTISAEDCKKLIEDNRLNPNFVILDVRTPGYWSSAHIEGSINRNYYDSDFDAQLDALPKHKTFLIHCQSGGRSAQTFMNMKNKNLKKYMK